MNLKCLLVKNILISLLNNFAILNPEIILERLTGDGKIDDLIAPLWSIKKVTILNDIDKK